MAKEQQKQETTDKVREAEAALTADGEVTEEQRRAQREEEAAELVRVKCRELQHAINAARSVGLTVQVYDQTKAMIFRIRKEKRDSGLVVAFSERL